MSFSSFIMSIAEFRLSKCLVIGNRTWLISLFPPIFPSPTSLSLKNSFIHSILLFRLYSLPCRSVGQSVRRSVRHNIELRAIIALLLLPNRPRLDCRVSGLFLAYEPDYHSTCAECSHCARIVFFVILLLFSRGHAIPHLAL